MKKEAKDSGEEEVQYPKTRGAYLVMTAARELREEGCDEGFAIIALGHALFAEERLEPAHGVPGRLWGSQRYQHIRGNGEHATGREHATHVHTHTHIHERQLGSSHFQQYIMCRTETFRLLLCCVATRARAFVSRTDPISSYF